MQDINIKLTAEVKEFLDATKAAKDSLGNIKTTNDQMKESLNTSFDNAAKDSGKLAQQAAAVNKLLNEQQKQLSDLIKYQQVLKKAQDSTNDPAKAKQYKEEIKQVDTEIKRLSGSLSGLSDKQQGVTKTGLLLASGLAAIGAAAIAATKACIQAAAATEQYRISFQTLTGSLAEGNKLFDDLIKLSANTPFELPQLQEAAKSLVAFGFGAQETITTLTALGDISAGVGQDKLPQLVSALGKVRATTRLTGESLQSFSDAGVPLLQVLADKGGVSVRQIQKDISAGKISFEETQAAIQSMSESGGKFFGLMEKQSKSLSGQLSNLKDAVGQLASDLGSILIPILKYTVGGLNGWIAAVKDGLGLSKDQNQAVEEQGEKFNSLVGVLKDVNSSYGSKQKAIATLKQEYPELIKGINLQTAGEAELNAIMMQGNITMKARIALNNKNSELTKVQSDLRKEYEQEAKTIEFIAIWEKQRAINAKEGGDTKQAEIALEKGKNFLERIRLNIGVLEAKEKLFGAESKTLSGGRNTSTITATGGDDDGKKEADKQKKIYEQLLKIDFDNIEKRKLQNKKGFDKELAELEGELNRQIEVQKKFQSETDNSKQGKTNRLLSNEIILKEKQDFETQKIELVARYAIEEINLRNEIADTLLKGQEKEETAALRAKEAFLKKIDNLQNGAEKIQRQEQAETAYQEALMQIKDKYALELINRNEKEDLEELDTMKTQFANILDAEEKKFKATKHGEEDITKFKAEQAHKQELIALELAKKELEIKVNSAKARLGVGTKEEQEAAQIAFDRLQAQLDQKTKQLTGERSKTGTEGGKKGNKKDQTLFELLGFSEDDAVALEKNVGKMVGYVNQLADARLKAADSAVKAAERQVEAAENALDREIKLGEAGFASNVSLKQRQLEEAKKTEQEALENKKKVARANLVVDSAQQASSIGVAAANLYKTWATLPFGVGLIAAGAQVASLIALISGVVAKSKAINTGYFEQGGQGRVGSDGVIIGNRHSDGGVPLEVEGGEFFASDGKRFGVVNRKMTDKHWSLLDAVNRDDKGAMFNYLSNMVELDRSFPDKFAASQHAKTVVINNSNVDETNRLLKQILSEARKDKTGAEITDLGDRVRIVRGNKTTILKK
jgi:tape measure domain-containing protein